MEKERISRIIANYNALEKDEKRKVANRISDVWQDVYDEYCEACSKDEKLPELYDKLAKIKSVGEFDLKKEYSEYEYQGDDGDFSIPVGTWVYYPDRFENAKKIAENFDEIQASLNDKLAELETKKMVLFRENRINKIKWQLKDNQKKAEHYNECMKKQAEKEYYEQNAETLIAPVVKEYKQLTEKYATETILKRAESDPIILCLSHTSNMSNSDENKRSFDVKPLNELCNNVRDSALFDVKCDLVNGRE